MKAISLIRVMIAMLLIHHTFSNKYMLMGGTIIEFLDNMFAAGDITYSQLKTITVQILKGNDFSFKQHRAETDFFLKAKESKELTNYIDGQAKAGKMTAETADYLHALFNLDEDDPLTGTPASVVADYTGNGNVEFLSWLDFDTLLADELYNGIWGYVTGEREYALACNSNGLHIIDVTIPENPVKIQTINMPGGKIWRDVAVHEDYAYVAAQSNGNFWVVDLSYLSSTSTPSNSDPIPSTGYVDRGRTNYGHTLNVADGLLYLNTAGSSRGCQIFDIISNPWDPPLIGNWSGTGRDCHDSFARNGIEVPGHGVKNLLYSADGYGRSFRISDITNIRDGDAPQFLGGTASISGIYAHQNYPTEDNKYLYTFDEFNVHDIGVWDVSNPFDISLVTTFQWSGDASENSIVHNGQVRGNYLHVAYYEAGYRVFDISNPENPVEVGHYETYRDPDGNGIFTKSITGDYEGAWNVYTLLSSGNVLVSDLNHGLFVFKINEVPVPNAPMSLTGSSFSNSVDLAWSASSGATGYTVKRSISSGGPYNVLAVNVVSTSYNDRNLDYGTYFYVVTATNAEGESSVSNEVDIIYLSCGDGVCDPETEAGVNPSNCMTENQCNVDCISSYTISALCGNGVCEGGNGENSTTCVLDCNGLTSGKPSNRFTCGYGSNCDNPACNDEGYICTMEPVNNEIINTCCGDGVCDSMTENFENCQSDCTNDTPAPSSSPPCLGRDVVCTSNDECCSLDCRNHKKFGQRCA